MVGRCPRATVAGLPALGARAMRLMRSAGVLLALATAIAAPDARAATAAVSAGGSHSLALHTDGTLRAWGDDSAGALGTGRSLLSLLPIPVAGLPRIVAVACGDFHAVALAA